MYVPYTHKLQLTGCEIASPVHLPMVVQCFCTWKFSFILINAVKCRMYLHHQMVKSKKIIILNVVEQRLNALEQD